MNALLGFPIAVIPKLLAKIPQDLLCAFVKGDTQEMEQFVKVT